MNASFLCILHPGLVKSFSGVLLFSSVCRSHSHSSDTHHDIRHLAITRSGDVPVPSTPNLFIPINSVVGRPRDERQFDQWLVIFLLSTGEVCSVIIQFEAQNQVVPQQMKLHPDLGPNRHLHLLARDAAGRRAALIRSKSSDVGRRVLSGRDTHSSTCWLTQEYHQMTPECFGNGWKMFLKRNAWSAEEDSGFAHWMI